VPKIVTKALPLSREKLQANLNICKESDDDDCSLRGGVGELDNLKFNL
jgi:hypothetical protein